MDTCPSVQFLVVFMNIIQSYVNKQSLEDLNSPLQLRDGDHYDFIVVGAGSSGCVLANRLSEIEGWKVLLLEAGGDEPLEMSVPAFREYALGTRMDWLYKTQAQPGVCAGKSCTWDRGKVLGGSSALNWMVYCRGNRRDYDGWQQLGNTGWGFEDVLPYFIKSENNLNPDIARDTEYHGTGGYLSVQRFLYADRNAQLILQAYKSMGLEQLDFNGPTQTGMMFTQGTQKNGERRSTNRAYIEPIRDVQRNLKVVTNVRVTKVLIDPENKTAYGIEFAGEKNRSISGRIFADKEITICGGTINSPQILQLSGIGPKDVVDKLGIQIIQDSKVGQNLQDHVGANGFTIKLNKRATDLSAKKELEEDMRWYVLPERSGPLTSVQTESVVGFIKSNYIPEDEDYPDTEIAYYPSIIPPENQNCSTDVISETEFYDRLAFAANVVRPESTGYIVINSTDPFEHPLIFPNYLNSSKDVDIIVQGFNFGVKALQNSILKNAGYKLNRTQMELCKDYEFGTDDYWICLVRNYTLPMFHPAGTCKMGPETDDSAVVDPELRVHGISGLRVADCSIMPKVISGNLNAVAIMIAERCADFIKRAWNESTRQKIQYDEKELLNSRILNEKVTKLYQSINEN